jgi:hypothetical protein
MDIILDEASLKTKLAKLVAEHLASTATVGPDVVEVLALATEQFLRTLLEKASRHREADLKVSLYLLVLWA